MKRAADRFVALAIAIVSVALPVAPAKGDADIPPPTDRVVK